MKISVFMGLVWVWGGISPAAGVLLFEPMDYPDGPLTTAPGTRWFTHSGTAGQVEAAAGQVCLTQAESEDVNAALAGSPYPAATNTVLYARVTVQFSALPAEAYFAHFKDAGTGFAGRLFATTNGAPAGTFRLGVSAKAAAPSAVFPLDLSLDTPYAAVMRYCVSNAQTTLWINPAAETEAGATSADTANPITVAAFALRQASGMGTLTLDDLKVGTAFAEVMADSLPEAPALLTLPQDQTAFAGDTVCFTVTATGTPPLAYQWQCNDANLAGAQASLLTLTQVTTNQAGAYAVVVSNPSGSVTSAPAQLTVLPRPAAVLTPVAYLRTLVDPENYLPSDTTQLWTVEGIVTTHTNLTSSGSALFFLQDNTAGIAVLVSGSSTVRPAAGDRVQVTGPLGQANGLLQLTLAASNPSHQVVTLSSGGPLPPALALSFAWQTDPAQIEPREGLFVVASNVWLDLSTGPTFSATGAKANLAMTNADGQVFVLRVDSQVSGLIGQAKPATAVTVYGVLTQNDIDNPRTSGYQLMPTRRADLVVPQLASVTFTHTLSHLVRPGDIESSTNLTEFALRPGETLALAALAFDGQGRPVSVRPGLEGLPASALWTAAETVGVQVPATFRFTPTAAEAGQAFVIRLEAINPEGLFTAAWSVYVPTPAEQQIILSELLANPTTNSDLPLFNPLRRDTPSLPARISAEDEFIELVNLGAEGIDLAGWTVADAVAVRHVFYAGDGIASSNAVIVYGGRLFGSAPNLPVPAWAATESTNGLSLNNGGDTLTLRNQAGQLILRVVYPDTAGKTGSLVRYPDLNGPWAVSSLVSSNAASPGLAWDGQGFGAPAAPAGPALWLTLSGWPALSVRLTWVAEPGRIYSVLRATQLAGPYTALVTGLTFADVQGQFTDPPLDQPQRFYRLRTP